MYTKHTAKKIGFETHSEAEVVVEVVDAI